MLLHPTHVLHRAFHPTCLVLAWTQASTNAVNNELERTKASPVIATLLLSPQTPPPIAKTEQIANFFISLYDAFVFGYCIFDMVLLLHKARELGAVDLLASPTSLMVSPHLLVRYPNSGNRLGTERVAQLAAVLDALLREHDASPRSLVHTVAQCGVACPLVVPFLRGVCLAAEVQHPTTAQAAYVLEALQTTGFASPQLFFDGNYSQRHRHLTRLLLSSAREFGSAVVLYTGLELTSQQLDAATVYEVSRCTCHALAKEDRRKLDWALKIRGETRFGFGASRGWTHH
jgi:hypothetical protein